MKKILLISSIVLLTACATPYPSNYGRGGYYPNQNVQRPYYSGGNYYNNARNYRRNDNDNRYNNGGNGYREGRRDND